MFVPMIEDENLIGYFSCTSFWFIQVPEQDDFVLKSVGDDISENGWIPNRPNPGNLIQGLRDYGYTVETAIADIIDNSITAGATEIDIRHRFNPEDESGKPVLAIIDNGCGMNRSELLEAMKPASRDPSADLQKDQLGRFGLGMKTASFSQCRQLEVLSRKSEEEPVFAATWDLDRVVKEDDWVMHFEKRSDISDSPFLDEVRGWNTAVYWRKLDRLLEREGEYLGDDPHALKQHLNRVMGRVSEHLGLHFHRFLKSEGGSKPVRIRINNSEVLPRDPFMDATWAPVEKEIVHGSEVLIQTATIPHHSRRTSQNSQQFGEPKDDFANQGFYVYREKRLISFGTWFNLTRKEERFRLTRIQVDIPNALDRYWALDVKKSFVRPPKELLAHLKSLIERMGRSSTGLIRKRGRKLRAPDGVSPIWNQIRREGRICWEVNSEHPEVEAIFKDMRSEDRNRAMKILKLVCETLPVSDIYSEMTRNSDQVDVMSAENSVLGKSILEGWLVFTELLSMNGEEAVEKMIEIPPYNANPEKSRKALLQAIADFKDEDQTGETEGK